MAHCRLLEVVVVPIGGSGGHFVGVQGEEIQKSSMWLYIGERDFVEVLHMLSMDTDSDFPSSE